MKKTIEVRSLISGMEVSAAILIFLQQSAVAFVYECENCK